MTDSLPARRRARALELHRARLTYADIARSPDVDGGTRTTLYSSPGRAHEAVQTARRHETAGIPWSAYAAALDSREQDLALLDRTQHALEDTLAEGGATGVKAAEALVRITERRAAILGTDHEHGLDAAVQWAQQRANAGNDRSTRTIALAERYALEPTRPGTAPERSGSGDPSTAGQAGGVPVAHARASRDLGDPFAFPDDDAAGEVDGEVDGEVV